MTAKKLPTDAAVALVQSGVRYKRVELYRAAASWLHARLRRPALGASDVAAIRGIHPWRSEWDAWVRLQDLKKGKIPEQEESDVMARGHILELPTLQLLARQAELRLYPCTHRPVVVRHPEHHWATCSPDAVALTEGLQTIGIEAKSSTMDASWGPSCEIPSPVPQGYEWPCPPYYAVQVYWTMALCGLPWLLVRLGGYYRLQIYRFQRDPALEQEILEHAGAWWERHMVRGEEPQVDGSEACAEWVARTPEGGLQPPRQATRTERRLLEEYVQLSRQRRSLDQVLPELRNRIVSLAGPTEGLQLGKTTIPIIRREGRAPTLRNLEEITS